MSVEIDPITRPFAHEMGEGNWDFRTQLFDAPVVMPIYEQIHKGHLNRDEADPILEHIPTVVEAAAELGYLSRRYIRHSFVGKQLGMNLCRVLLEEDYEAVDEHLDSIYDVPPGEHAFSPENRDRSIAISELEMVLPRVAAKSYKWGRTGTLAFLTEHDSTATVAHHGDLTTTDLDVESKIVSRLWNHELRQDEPAGLFSDGILRAIQDWVRGHRITSAGARTNVKTNITFGKFQREFKEGLPERRAIYERIQQELRGDPIAI